MAAFARLAADDDCVVCFALSPALHLFPIAVVVASFCCSPYNNSMSKALLAQVSICLGEICYFFWCNFVYSLATVLFESNFFAVVKVPLLLHLLPPAANTLGFGLSLDLFFAFVMIKQRFAMPAGAAAG